MTYSVVVPVYNGLSLLKKNLPSIMAIGADEVILVDDASADGSADFVRRNFPEIKIIVHRINQRFPVTVNDGFQTAGGDWVILLNQDVRPQKDLLTTLSAYVTDPRLAAVTFNENRRSWALARLKKGVIDYTNGPIDNHVHFSLWASGGSAAFNKTVWKSLGGFDPVFSPGYYEDFDYGYRCWKRGYRIIWNPRSKVNHTPETSFRMAFPPAYLTRLKDRNYLLCHWKNLDATNLPAHTINLLKRCLTRPGYLLPVIWALASLGHIFTYRKKAKPVRQLSDSQMFSLINTAYNQL